jgi:hypothetical protein
VLLTKYRSGDQIEKNEMGVWWRGEAYIGSRLGNLGGKDYLGDPGVDGRIILMDIRELG